MPERATSRALEQARHIADLRALAERRLPAPIFAYLEGGSFDEVTMRANETDLAALKLRQQVMLDVSDRCAATTIAGHRAALPLAIAPVGMAGIFWPDGEVQTARAAKVHGVPFCLSTFSMASLADIATATNEPFMFQLYVFRDRGVNAALVERARDAGCTTLVVTMDCHERSPRHAEAEHGLTIPLRLTPKFLVSVLKRPAWVREWLARKKKTFGNLVEFAGEDSGLGGCSAWAEKNYKGTFERSDLEWLRKTWDGTLVVKGILDAEDARLAADLGVDAIVVSNHGGRQMDSVLSSAAALPAIRDAVGDTVELILDSGIRSGIDVLKSLGLGAQGCLIGRAAMYGLAAGGQAGVRRSIEILAGELDTAMALTGVTEARRVPGGLVLAR